MHSQNKSRKLFPLLLAVPLLSAFALAQTAPSPDEQALLQMANQARSQHNLAPLHWNPALAAAAKAHVQRLVREPGGELQHQYPGEPDLMTRAAQNGAHFSTVAENLAGRGQSPATIQQTWMSTPTHRANLLDPNLNAAGIAVIESQGLLYAVEDFARDVPVQSHDGITKHVAQLLQEHGIAPAPSNDDAQATCGMTKGAAGSPKLVIQWDGPDPTQLPDVLLKQIATGSYTSAGVGVCPGQQANNQQFTTYHVAVLLY